MNNKKALVVYYSKSGTTRKVANEIKELLKCDIEEIIDKKERRGPLGYMLAGRAALKDLTTEINDSKFDPSQYDTIIIGTPVWAGRLSSAVRTYMIKNRTRIKNCIFFCTQNGADENKVFNDMKEACSNEPLSTLRVSGKQIKDGSYRNEIAKFIEGLK